MKNLPETGVVQGRVTRFRILHVISPEQLRLETSYFVYGLAMWSISLVMTGCPLNGRGQGHVSNFYILDLENFATASRLCTGTPINSSTVSLWITLTTVKCVVTECTSHTLIYCNTLTPLLRFVLDLSYKLYLHCYARIWLTRRVARSVCDSIVSCSCMR